MKKILIVDDRPEIRELVSVTLEIDDRCILLQAANGYEALSVIQSEMLDIVLLDIMMPGDISGLDVCCQIKANQRTHHIYVIILSAQGQECDIQAGFAAGADDYFLKPFSPLELIRKVEKILPGC
nr:response regulator [Anaerolineae bacterium]